MIARAQPDRSLAFVDINDCPCSCKCCDEIPVPTSLTFTFTSPLGVVKSIEVPAESVESLVTTVTSPEALAKQILEIIEKDLAAREAKGEG